MDDFLTVVSILKEGSVVVLTGGHFHINAPSIKEYSSNPLGYWREYSTLYNPPKTPNIINDYLYRLQRSGILREIITEDIRGSSQAAGCNSVIELHGSYDTGTCIVCGTKSSLSDQSRDKTPICGTCQGLIIPSIYFSPDKDALDQALKAASNCNALLLLDHGDWRKYPFSLLVRIAKRCGSEIIGIGSQSDDLMDVILDGDPQLILSKILKTT